MALGKASRQDSGGGGVHVIRVSGPGHKRKDHVTWRAPGGLCRPPGIQNQGLTGDRQDCGT